MLNKLAKYLFGFSYLGARGTYRFSKRIIKGVYKNIHAVFPFLSQTEILRWAITGDIKMVSDEIGHSSVVMTEKYAKCNLRRLQDDFPSLADRIALRLVPPTEDVYFKNLLQIV